ncbi:hypothetical protein F2Q68_00010311 [Brassica cretica]|uniref:Uncharacterized protein n=1 Tax=Brassica cretica TaxID=69181 RepID=A0A8S9L0B3_BRACR|nr:hypothetical protein F2Q68_00010311 [Brassica cretica]
MRRCPHGGNWSELAASQMEKPGTSSFSSRTSIKVATMSHGSVSIDVRTEELIDVGWKISIDGRVSSVSGGERVSVDETSVWVDDG